MTRELVVAEPSDPVQEVAGLMGRHGVHRVPVVQNERPIGMLSADDIARFYDDDVAIIELERSLASYIGAPLPLT
jgi:CBS domain-containing protein